jgi:hypothetical protein
VSTSVKLSIGTLAVMVGLGACGRTNTASNNDDFSRDLQLAGSSVDLAAPKVDPANLSALETQPSSSTDKAAVVKKAPSGNRAVASKTPTVRSAPTQEVAAADDAQQTQIVAQAPAPEPTPEPVAQAPQPTTSVITDNGGDDGDYGTSGNGGGIFGPGSGPTGTVIRGGGVGDGDNCEHDGGVIYGRGYPRGTQRPPVYMPNPGGVGTGRTSGRPAGGIFGGRTGTRRRTP